MATATQPQKKCTRRPGRPKGAKTQAAPAVLAIHPACTHCGHDKFEKGNKTIDRTYSGVIPGTTTVFHRYTIHRRRCKRCEQMNSIKTYYAAHTNPF